MEVVDAIAAVKCDRFDRPLEDVVIEKVTVVDGDSYGGKAERK